MILPDVNLLICAVDETSVFHGAGRRWWDETLSSPLPVGLCYPSVLGFVRITTSRQILESPLEVGTAVALVESWLAQPQTNLLAPTSRHWDIVSELLRVTGVGGNLTTDADIAAYAIEHGGTLYSNDGDFARFPGLRWKNPLAAR